MFASQNPEGEDHGGNHNRKTQGIPRPEFRKPYAVSVCGTALSVACGDSSPRGGAKCPLSRLRRQLPQRGSQGGCVGSRAASTNLLLASPFGRGGRAQARSERVCPSASARWNSQGIPTGVCFPTKRLPLPRELSAKRTEREDHCALHSRKTQHIPPAGISADFLCLAGRWGMPSQSAALTAPPEGEPRGVRGSQGGQGGNHHPRLPLLLETAKRQHHPYLPLPLGEVAERKRGRRGFAPNLTVLILIKMPVPLGPARQIGGS